MYSNASFFFPYDDGIQSFKTLKASLNSSSLAVVVRDNVLKINEAIDQAEHSVKYSKYIKSMVFKYFYAKHTMNKRLSSQSEASLQLIAELIEQFTSFAFILDVRSYNNITHIDDIHYIFEHFADKSLYKNEIAYLIKHNLLNISNEVLKSIDDKAITEIESNFMTIRRAIEVQKLHCNLKKFLNSFAKILNLNTSDELMRSLENEGVFPTNIIELRKIGESEIYNEFNDLSHLLEIIMSDDLLEFVSTKTSDQIRNLVDVLDDSEESQKSKLQAQEVLEFCDVVSFFEGILLFKTKLKEQTTSCFLNEFIEYYKNFKCDKASKNFEGKLLQVKTNRIQYEKLIDSADKLNRTIIVILDIAKNSIFEIDKSNRKYEWKITVNPNSNNPYTISFNYICDLAETISYMLNRGDDDIQQESTTSQSNNKQIFKLFCQMVAMLQVIDGLFKQLRNKGWLTYEFEPVSVKENKDEEKNLMNLNNELKLRTEDIEKDLEKITQMQIAFYVPDKETKLSFYIFGNQFNDLYQYMLNINNKNHSTELNIKINHLIDYITHNNFDFKLEKNSFKITDNEPISISNNTEKILMPISAGLAKIFKYNKITSNESLYEKNFITNNADSLSSKICLFKYETNLYMELLGVYIHYTSALPLAQTTLICNEDTTTEEIMCFLYKVLYCKAKVLFFIVNTFLLSSDKVKFIQTFIEENYLSDVQSTSTSPVLMFGYNDERNPIYEALQRKDIHVIRVPSVNVEEQIKNDLRDMNITLVTADESGRGKTFYIRKQAEHMEYTYFPIGSHILPEKLVIRLRKVKFTQNTTLHIDLTEHYAMTPYNLTKLHDFLFRLLVLKVYNYKEDFICLYHNTKIFVEIPNGFLRFVELFPFLSRFKTVKISGFVELDYQVENDKLLEESSNLNILMNYITMTNFEKFNICFKGILEKREEGMDTESKRYSLEKARTMLFGKEIGINKKTEVFKTTMNYYQIKAILDILGENLKALTMSVFLNVNRLWQYEKRYRAVKSRVIFVDSLLSLTSYLINPDTYKELKSQQKNAIDSNQKPSELKGQTITFDQIKQSIIFIDEVGSLTIIPVGDNKEEYNILKELRSGDALIQNKESKDFGQLKRFTSWELLMEIKRLMGLPFQEGVHEQTKMPYVFTADNFTKVMYIMLRMRSNIPVIMMGETGCGKTSLIKVLAEIKGVNLRVFNVHAGTTEEDIIKFFYDDDKLKPLKEGESDEEGFNPFSPTKQEWVFFDEINTCDALGMIAEVLCKRTLNGEPLRSCLRFFAACNPFKVYEKKRVSNALQITKTNGSIDNNNNKQSNLVYLVKPLPNCLLNYVFYFGSLKKEDEMEYIKKILESEFDLTDCALMFGNDKDKPLTTLCSLYISSSQQFFREIAHDFSVSLRDIRRFALFYKWFKHYYAIKAEVTGQREWIEPNQCSLNSVALALYMCYYIRLSKTERNEYIRRMKEVHYIGILEVAEKEQVELSKYILDPYSEDSKGIARNKNILANMFCVFTCINAKVPLILCGKPGCSKSLSVLKVHQAMKGRNSENEFLRHFPDLHMKHYQGSLKSTSEGIEKVFTKAREFLDDFHDQDKQEEYLSVVFFEELGLAERAASNPLKVLHYELEYEQDVIEDVVDRNNSHKFKTKVGFVGISNWELDNAKMNRMVFHYIPDMEENDLFDTAKCILNIYSEELAGKYEWFLKVLVKTYYEFTNSNNNRETSYFFGTRDFYYLIKYVGSELHKHKQQLNEFELKQIAYQGLERNFGGLAHTHNEDIFTLYDKILQGKEKIGLLEQSEASVKVELLGVKANILNNIDVYKDNDYDNSRFLMLITKPSLALYLIRYILEPLNKKMEYFVGTTFSNDDNSDEQSVFQDFNKAQFCLKQNVVLCMMHLDKVYPSFYEVFNKNYVKIKEKLYARIAYGNKRASINEININFRCIIIVDEKHVFEQSPPFLNRFEKQRVSFRDILCNTHIDIAKRINEMFNDMKRALHNKAPYIKLVNVYLDEIMGLLYKQYNNKENISYETAMQFVLETFMSTFSKKVVDVIVNDDEFRNMHGKEVEVVEKGSQRVLCENVRDYIKEKMVKMYNVIYTYSSMLDEEWNKEEFMSKVFPGKTVTFNKEAITIVELAKYKNIKVLNAVLSSFFVKRNGMFVFKLKENEVKHLVSLKQYVSEVNQKVNTNNKEILNIVMFVVCLQKEKQKEEEKMDDELYLDSISFLDDDVQQHFIEQL